MQTSSCVSPEIQESRGCTVYEECLGADGDVLQGLIMVTILRACHCHAAGQQALHRRRRPPGKPDGTAGNYQGFGVLPLKQGQRTLPLEYPRGCTGLAPRRS